MDRQTLLILMEGGYIYLGMGRFQEAREGFEGVAGLAPENEIPLVAIGTSLFAQLKFDQAIRAYRKAVAVKKDSSFAHAYLGEALFFRGRNDEAVQELEKASSLDPGGTAGDFA